MDILKKMFGKSQDEKEHAQFKDEFRKPTWFEESETDDELFDSDRKFMFQLFTNPLELQKHFDQQMQELLKTFKQHEDNSGLYDRNFREEYLKPGFEEHLIEEMRKNSKSLDTDLDGEIYADQLHSLLQRLSPEIRSMLPEDNKKPKLTQPKQKLSDEETIMGRIHGTLPEGDQGTIVRRREKPITGALPKNPQHYGGVFEGTYQGPKMFGQSIMSQTVRKPDGSYETKRTVRDTDGNVKTTIIRSVDGKTESITTYGDKYKKELERDNKMENLPSSSLFNRNIFVSENGYALPKNLW